MTFSKCVVRKCTNKSGRINSVSFHEFPSKGETKLKWIAAILENSGFDEEYTNVKDYSSKFHCVCSSHFESSAFRDWGKTKRLKAEAVPTIFPKPTTSSGKRLSNEKATGSPKVVVIERTITKILPKPMDVATDGTYQTLTLCDTSDFLASATTISHDSEILLLSSNTSSPHTPLQGENGSSVGSDSVSAPQCTSNSHHQHEISSVQQETSKLLAPILPNLSKRKMPKNTDGQLGAAIRSGQSQSCVTSPKQSKRKHKMIIQRLYRERKRNFILKQRIKELEQQLKIIPDHLKSNILKIKSGVEEGNKNDKFLMDQLVNYGKKNGARWNQVTISHCIILQARAPGVYEFLRNSDLLHLPCKDTLRAYTGKSTLETGVSSLVIKRLQYEAEKLNEIEKYGSLIVDEMTISPSENYVPNLEKFCGKVDMGGVVKIDDEDKLANRMLGLVFSGLSTYYKIPVAYFLVNQLNADQQLALVTDVIKKVEATGFKVVRVVTDNLSVNVTMFSKMNGNTHCPIVRHPVQPYTEKEMEILPCVFRPLFLSYDYCHVTKNIRNQFLDRNFHINGEEISSKYAKLLFDLQKGELAKAVRNWTEKQVRPNSLEKQKVKPAMDMFRPEVTAAIEMNAEHGVKGFENVEPTVNFMKTIHRWISIHDISSSKEHMRKILPDKQPFYKADDQRLSFLEVDIPLLLQTWEKEVKILVETIPAKESQKRKEEKLKFLTKETYHAIMFTSQSTVECVRYLLQDIGFYFVLTRRLSSDNIEELFGALRQMVGGNFKGDAVSFSQAFEKVLRTGIAYTSVNGNTRLSRESERQYQLIRNNDNEKKRAGNELIFLPSSEIRILDNFLTAPGEVPTTSQASTIAFMAGYVIRVLEEQEFCQECIEKLKGEKSSHPIMSLIRLLDRGALVYPSIEFLSRLWTVYQFLLQALPKIEKSTHVLRDLVTFLTPKMEHCSTFQCQLAAPGETNKELVSLILQKFISPMLVNKANLTLSKKIVQKKFIPHTKNRRLGTLKQ